MKTKNIPPLRFPEFKECGEWKETTLEQEVYYENGKAHENDISESGQYIVVNSKFISTDGAIIKYTNSAYCIAEKRDILMVLSDVPNGRAIAKCFIVNGNDTYTVNQRVCKLKPKKAIGLLLYYIIDRNPYLLKFDDGIKQTNLKKDDVLNCPFRLPKDIKEQQLIADCLSSLDDLISAVSEKIGALKLHKKGLMQQLFPAEGKTTPALRFSEFKDSGEWEVRTFSKYIKLYRGSSPRPIQQYLTQIETGINWIKIGDTKSVDNYIIYKVEEKITKEGALRSRKVSKGELILANSMSFGKTYQLGIDGYIYDGWFVLREYEEHFYKPFLLQLLNSEYMQNQYKRLSAGGIVQNISSEIVYNTILPRTSIPEQQKIADFLSSIDEQIAAEAQKLDQLKAHKKGLMQQLFPNLNTL